MYSSPSLTSRTSLGWSTVAGLAFLPPLRLRGSTWVRAVMAMSSASAAGIDFYRWRFPQRDGTHQLMNNHCLHAYKGRARHVLLPRPTCHLPRGQARHRPFLPPTQRHNRPGAQSVQPSTRAPNASGATSRSSSRG